MIKEKFLVNNDTYKNPTNIKPEYIIVHSTGVGYKNKDVLFNGWNKPNKLSIHGIVDNNGSYHTLPLNFLAWHVGKKGNDKTVGFEICEPKNIAYADKAHTRIDTIKYNPKDPANIADFNKRYSNAVEMAVYFCRQTGLGADKLLSHREACARGIASNHADVEHWFPLFGKSMNDFRADVKKILAQKPNPNTGGTVTKKYYRVQAGAFLARQKAEDLVRKLHNLGFDAIVVKSGIYYKVQCGAFSNKDTAQRLVDRLLEVGIKAIIKYS